MANFEPSQRYAVTGSSLGPSIGRSVEKNAGVFSRAYISDTPLRIRLILGPPGTGKTWRVAQIVDAELRQGRQPERIAIVTFTRAAKREILGRLTRQFSIAERRFCWVRTIHSSAFSLLELDRKRIMEDERWAEFATRYGYDLSEPGCDLEDTDPVLALSSVHSPDDLLRYAYEWGRNCMLDPEATLARCPAEGISASQFRLFVQRLEAFKKEHDLLDFPDLLTEVLERGKLPNVDVAIVDEAHDLSPLQVRVVEAWFDMCEQVVIAADDDQAIFNFQGADATWIQELAQHVEPEILSRSHRVPVLPHALAERIIRMNRHRVQKVYEPTEDLGGILRCDLDQALDLVDGARKTFVLCRNRIFFKRVAAGLVRRAVPFLVEGWGAHSPFSRSDVAGAIRVSYRLVSGDEGPFPVQQIGDWLAFIPAREGLALKAARTKVKDRKGLGSFTRTQLSEELDLGDLLATLSPDRPFDELQKLQRGTRMYLRQIVARYGELPAPVVYLNTIHGAKGLEAPLVITLPDMTRVTHREYLTAAGNESENRVFYVAVTRTQETLVLVEPRGPRHYDFPVLRIEEGKL